jgi:hypothetical protein
MIEKRTRDNIRNYLQGFVRGLIDAHRPEKRAGRVAERRVTNASKEGNLKPFHEAIIPAEVIRISEFERSFSTKLGTTFEECARLIALQTFEVAQRGYRATGVMPLAAAAKIEELVAQLGQAGKHLSFPEMIERVLSIKDQTLVARPAIADLYLKESNGREHYFEIKSPKPNKGQCLEITERLLRIHAIKQANRPLVNAYFAMGYNPYGSTKASYTHSFGLQYLDIENELLLGQEFWAYIGGPGTLGELLEVYQEVGYEMGKTIVDELAFDF